MIDLKNKKILLIISSQEYFRNYILSNSLSEIKESCFYLLDKKIFKEQDLAILGNNKIINYSYPAKKSKLHQQLFNINMRRFRHLSKTFGFRLMTLRRRLQILYKILGLPIAAEISKFIILGLTKDQTLSKIISDIKPDLILMPSSGYEGLTFELIRIGHQQKIPTCLLIDNWDNLISKTIFTIKPDYVSVWGDQSVKFARDIHGIQENKIFVLGTPRFIPYFKPAKTEPPYPFKYVVFAGNAIPFDELTTLKKLDEIISQLPEDKKITIIYRPHPWHQKRKTPDVFFDYDYKHVRLDSQAREYYKREFGYKFAPDPEYYPKLLANMEFMICPLSTMLIEGLLFNKKVFVLTYDDGIHLTSPKNAFYYYEHFEGIKYLSNVTIIDEFEKLDQIFRPTNKTPGQTRDLSYYITPETKQYPTKLKELVQKILNKQANEKGQNNS